MKNNYSKFYSQVNYLLWQLILWGQEVLLIPAWMRVMK